MYGIGQEEDPHDEEVRDISERMFPDKSGQSRDNGLYSFQHLSAANQRRETISRMGGNMRGKKKSRSWEEENGSRTDRIILVNSILSDRHIKNKIRKAFYHGSVAGCFLAFLGGACYIETSILEGLFIAVTGLAWMLVFYLRNPEDELYG